MTTTNTKRKTSGRWVLWLVWGVALVGLLVSCWVSQHVGAGGRALPGLLRLALVWSGATLSFFSVYLFTTRNDS